MKRNLVVKLAPDELRAIGAALGARIAANGFRTAAEFARRAGVSPESVRAIVQGRNTPSLGMLAMLCRALGAEVADLLGGIPIAAERPDQPLRSPLPP